MLTLATVLRRHSISHQNIVAAVKQHVGLEPDDMLFIAGSLAVGLGNDQSDLDLFLISHRERYSDLSFANAKTFCIGSLNCDLECFTVDTVRQRINELDEVFNSLFTDIRRSVEIPLRRLDFLYRLFSGIAIVNETDLNTLKNGINQNKFCSLLVARSSAVSISEHQDMVGFLGAGQYEVAVLSAQRLMDIAVDAVLAALGNMNVKEKWRALLIQQFATKGWDAHLPGGPLLSSLLEQFMAFKTCCGYTPKEARHTCRQAAHFANRVLPWAQLTVSAQLSAAGMATPFEIPERPTATAQPNDIPTLLNCTGPAPTPLLTPDVQLSFNNKQWYMHSFKQNKSWKIKPLMYEALCCLDGVRSYELMAEHLKLFSSVSYNDIIQSLKSATAYTSTLSLMETDFESM